LPRLALKTKLANRTAMENSKIISKEYYRNHLLCFSEALATFNTGETDCKINADNSTQAICIGEVFRADERIAYCESVDKDSARQYCRQIVDSEIARSSNGRIPELSDLGDALQKIRNQLDPRLLKLLEAHTQHQNQPISIDTLKQAGNFHSTTAVYLAYAELARLICDALSYIPTAPPTGQDPYLGMIIETVEPDMLSAGSLSLRLTSQFYTALGGFFPSGV
jgi:hypothetical protein